MPFRSEAQRRYIYAQAAEGKAWAVKFLRDMGLKPPGVREAIAHRMKRRS
jgi:hypothetical protein